NPHIIKINPGVTDGSPSRWPQGVVLNEGHVENNGAKNWYEAVPKDEGRHLSMRFAVGNELAEWLDLKSVKAGASVVIRLRNDGIDVTNGSLMPGGQKEVWILDAFPDHYKYFLHHSGRSEVKDRIDPYVFGEYFLPLPLAFLTSASPKGTCVTAKFRTSNEIIPHLYWLIINGPGNKKACGCKYCGGHRLQADVNVQFGLVDHTPSGFTATKKPRLTQSPAPVKKIKKVEHAPGKVKEREKEKEKEKEKKRLHEVPEKKRTESSSKPTYKGAYTNPARDQDLVDGASFRKGEMVWAELPKPLVDPTGASITHWPAMIAERNVDSHSQVIDAETRGKATTFNIRQSWKYKVRLFALRGDLTRREDEILPFLGSACDMPLEPGAMVAPDSVKLIYDGQKVLRPTLDQITSIALAATPFALALQICAHIVANFSPTDTYFLQDTHITNNGKLSPDQLELRSQHLKLPHYHYLWWGGEKIWSGELVRLLSDDTVVLPGQLSPGAAERCVFLKIAGIYKKGVAGKETGHVTGVLFELVEITTAGGGVGIAGGSAMSLFEKKPQTGTKISAEDMFMPEPPPGFAFRRVTPPGDNAIHLEVEFIAGRYYPLPSRLHDEQKVRSIIERTNVPVFLPEGGVSAVSVDTDQRAVALAGLLPALCTYMRCEKWAPSRVSIVDKAEQESRREMRVYITSVGGI
ncbi:hypothetical protein P7C70_g3565, partial [Phenoliferia sp. Uapishka_3]